MKKSIPRSAALALLLVLSHGALALPIVVGSFDSSRTSLPFDDVAFEEARAALSSSFDSFTTVYYPTIPNQPAVDLMFLTNAGMTTPLSPAEQAALVDFVNGGGTLLLSARGGNATLNQTAASLLEPFRASTSGLVSAGTRSYPTIPNAPVFAGVTTFTNTDATEIKQPGDAVVAALGDFGPVLLYYPTIPNLPVPRIGEIIAYSNESAFVDTSDGGHFGLNRQLFLNVANAAAGQTVPEPGTIVLFGLGVLALARRKRRARLVWS